MKEIKINKEIRNYTESMFLGLTMRQFLFSMLACGVAVGLFFLLRSHLDMEMLSWVCVLGAAPFAVLGFVKYNGMTIEKFLLVWFRYHFQTPKQLLFHPTNYYYEALRKIIESYEKERQERHD